MATTGSVTEAASTEDAVINIEDHVPNEEISVDEDEALERNVYKYVWEISVDEALERNVYKYVWDNYFGMVKIPRVPKRLRLDEDDAYEPKIISFGPYHRGQDRLKDMEEHKQRYLEAILFRCGSFRDPLENQIKKLEADVRRCYSKDIRSHLEDKIKELEADVRRCYSKDIGGHLENKIKDFEADVRSCCSKYVGLVEENGEFVNMMMLDGCFIVEYLLRWFLKPGLLADLNMIKGVHTLLMYDIILLENQLPFFLLEHIFNHVKEHQQQLSQFTFMHLCINYFKSMFEKEISLQHPKPAHFLHLYHSTFGVNSINADTDDDNIGTETRQERKESTICDEIKKIATTAKNKVRRINAARTDAKTEQRITSATVLHEHGITFKKKKGSNILDVKFCKGVLEIPHLLVDDFTNSQFRNLIAFEQLYPQNGKLLHNFKAYASFMDQIVNTPEDVALLLKKGILQHSLGSDKDVADLFNNLNKGTFIDEHHYLSDMYEDVMEYQNHHWPRSRANLCHNYFNTPWAMISVAAAAILLVFAIVQTVFSGISTF